MTLTAGKTFLDGAVSLSGYLNYRQSEQVNLGDRSLSACEVTQTIATGVLNCTRSTYTQAGTIVRAGSVGQHVGQRSQRVGPVRAV